VAHALCICMPELPHPSAEQLSSFETLQYYESLVQIPLFLNNTKRTSSRVSAMSVSKCCITGFEWDGEPTGHIVPFPTTSNQAYVTGSSSSAAILFICDLFGWEFRNNRLLADHSAQAVGATVYVPDL